MVPAYKGTEEKERETESPSMKQELNREEVGIDIEEEPNELAVSSHRLKASELLNTVIN